MTMKETRFWSMMLLVMLVTQLLATSCSKDSDNDDGNKYSEYASLFTTTDKMINALPYSGSGGIKSETTSDNNYTVGLIGRIITVKKKSYAGPSYSGIKDALYDRYRNNSKVSDVFLNNAGTVTIDCR